MIITNTYLVDPETFTAKTTGLANGERSLFINFVGGPYHVKGLNDQQVSQLRRHFSEACSTDPEFDAGSCAHAVDIHVYRVADKHFHLPDPPPEYRNFELDAHENRVNIAGENMFGMIDLSGTLSGHLWTLGHEQYFHSNTFENFFRMLVTYRLLERGGMLLHSAGIVNREKAFLFPGRSEDGKSTLSRLSAAEGRIVLSDDMNAVTWQDGQYFVEKVPFTGDLERNWTRSRSYPLKAIFAISKAAATSIEELSASQTLALLISCTPYINSDSYRMTQLLENHYQLTQKVPAHILEFSLSGGLWKAIEATVEDD